MTNTNETNLADLGDDLKITKSTQRQAAGGSWIDGTIAGCRFSALVFPQHADNPEWEVNGNSKISKLWIQRIADRKTTYSWDRGADVNAADATTQAIVDFLAAGLAEHTFAK